MNTGRPTRTARRKRDKARLVVNVLIAFIILATIFNSLAAFANLRSSVAFREAAAAQSSPSFKVRYDDLGGQVVSAWISGESPVVDTIDGLVWPTEGESGMSVASVSFTGGNTVAIDGTSDFHESLSYVVVIDDGSQFTATIEMGIISGPPARPVLLSAPFVQPRAEVSVIARVGTPSWENFPVGSESPIIAQANNWATAWTTNSTSELKSLTGDSSLATYTGLVSEEEWSVVEGSTRIMWAAVRPDDGMVVARYVWDIQATVEESDPDVEPPQPKTIRQSIDLLVADAGSGLPRIVAWGDPGTYADLTPLQNATNSGE